MPGFLAEKLYQPENRHFHTALKTAEKSGHPPTLYLLKDRKNGKKWSEVDKKLMLAWTTYQDEMCPRCGIPMWLGHSEDPNIEFHTEITVCYSCQHIGNDKKPEPEGGTKYNTPAAVEIEGEDTKLPTRAEGYKTSQ